MTRVALNESVYIGGIYNRVAVGMPDIYNPLDKINLGKSVAEALLNQPSQQMQDLVSFKGAGIYVIYYTGSFPLYTPIRQANADSLRWPIYIGKAIPSGGRRGASMTVASDGPYLYKRLREHRDSIADVEANATDNLKVSDFQVKYLIVDDIWIPLGESLLISTFKPVWNGVLDGFGNHNPGSGRIAGLRPLWDTLHPGRSWAPKYPARPEPMADIEAKVATFLEAHSAPRSGHMKFTP